MLLSSASSSYAQSKTIRGRVITDDFMPLPGVVIRIDKTVEIGKSDLEGFFEINIPVSVKKISFSAIGIEEAYTELADDCEEVELVMLSRGTYCFSSAKKIDRLRIRKFKKILGVHKEAFEKGIFKEDKACYTQIFKPLYTKERK
ncbi:carboxypeptidase-like regulatory domain-containing protein [Hymenobacter psychrotolerans]|uniref:carboxypeptidase-like regulatory domain-containing protein n=1 Tax=Hymenobacter psychrotolerans TaxID=344998 RepID=UPI001114CF7D|nr:carboxypeptidase-like regulatory domain-containing protein [Hymenobacter psychrotolerans]